MTLEIEEFFEEIQLTPSEIIEEVDVDSNRSTESKKVKNKVEITNIEGTDLFSTNFITINSTTLLIIVLLSVLMVVYVSKAASHSTKFKPTQTVFKAW